LAVELPHLPARRTSNHRPGADAEKITLEIEVPQQKSSWATRPTSRNIAAAKPERSRLCRVPRPPPSRLPGRIVSTGALRGSSAGFCRARHRPVAKSAANRANVCKRSIRACLR
jgi:hypothetical protein